MNIKNLLVLGFSSIGVSFFAQSGNVGINTASPGTTLDVNGAITNRETVASISANAITVPANVSQVQLAGAATATVTITAPAAPNAGQRLVIYNNTSGGFGATLNGVTIPNGKALEFVYSNSGWRSTDGGSLGATPVNIYTADGTLSGNRTVGQGANTLAFTGTALNTFSVDNTTFSVDATNKRIGIGTTAPKQQIHIIELGANSGITTSFISGLAVTGTANQAQLKGPGFYLENTSAAAGSKLLKMNYSLNATEPILNIQSVSDDATIALSSIMTLTRSGKLGINATPNPASNLTVNGNAAIGNGYNTTAAPANGAIIQGNVGIGTSTPQRILDINASASPIRVSNLQTTNTGTNILTIDNSGDIRAASFSNLSAGANSLLSIPPGNYNATGDEAIIWSGSGGTTINLPIPTASQVGKSIYIINAVPNDTLSITGSTPTAINSTKLVSVPSGKRITIFAIATNRFGNSTNEWVVIAKDF